MKTQVVKKQPANGNTKPKTALKGKKKVSGFRMFMRTFMIILMIAYAIVVGIVGWWGFDNFFGFYFSEKSPVMGVNTEDSRVKDIPTITDADIKKGTEAILNAGIGASKVTVRQVGPTLHFYIVIAQDASVEQARVTGQSAIVTFADTLGKPEMFATYEAQIIVTKPELPKLDDATLLRPAGEEGAEQAFPQYGVSNKHTDGVNKGISWAQNGV